MGPEESLPAGYYRECSFMDSYSLPSPKTFSMSLPLETKEMHDGRSCVVGTYTPGRAPGPAGSGWQPAAESTCGGSGRCRSHSTSWGRELQWTRALRNGLNTTFFIQDQIFNRWQCHNSLYFLNHLAIYGTIKQCSSSFVAVFECSSTDKIRGDAICCIKYHSMVEVEDLHTTRWRCWGRVRWGRANLQRKTQTNTTRNTNTNEVPVFLIKAYDFQCGISTFTAVTFFKSAKSWEWASIATMKWKWEKKPKAIIKSVKKKK